MAKYHPPADMTLRVEAEPIPYSTWGGNEPDPDWRYTDAAGHDHYRENKAWPTLVWKPEIYWCHDCQDEHDDGHRECSICGEEIEPGTRPVPPHSGYIRGLERYYLNDEEISRERYEELAEQMRQSPSYPPP